MTARRKHGRGYSNPFKTPSFRRSMEAADDAWYAQQAEKRAAAANELAPAEEQQKPQGEQSHD